MKYYYIDKNQVQQGPADENELRAARINASTPVWYEGLSEWTTAGEIKELEPILATLPPPIDPVSPPDVPPIAGGYHNVPPRTTTTIRKTSKTTAYILAALATAILTVASPVITAFIASLAGTQPQVIILPFLILATVCIVVLFAMKKRETIKKLLFVFIPIAISLAAGSLFYNTIRKCGRFHNGLAEVYNGQYGIINRFGFTVLPMIYDNITPVWRPPFTVTMDGQFGIFDKNGYAIVPCIYEDIVKWEESGIYEVTFNGKVGLLEPDGTELVPCEYFYIWYFKDGLAKVNKGGYKDDGSITGGTWGYIDRSGEEIISCTYTSLGDFEGTNSVTGRDGNFRYEIDRQGKILDCTYIGLY